MPIRHCKGFEDMKAKILEKRHDESMKLIYMWVKQDRIGLKDFNILIALTFHKLMVQ